MRVAVLVSHLMPGSEDAYEDIHAQIPDELLLALVGAGVRDWAIWRSGTKLLHLVDVDDYVALERTLATDPANQVWQARITEYVSGFSTLETIPLLNDLRLVWSLQRQLASP